MTVIIIHTYKCRYELSIFTPENPKSILNLCIELDITTVIGVIGVDNRGYNIKLFELLFYYRVLLKIIKVCNKSISFSEPYSIR